MEWAIAALLAGAGLLLLEEDYRITVHPRESLALPPSRPLRAGEIPVVQPVEYYDWGGLVNEPHLLIAGPTGAGKTTLAKKLLHRLGGEAFVIDPHSRRADWGLPVVGEGRDYRGINESLVGLVRIMTDRYASAGSHPPLTVVLDEVPAIAANCAAWKETFPTLVREARKVGIRLLVLTQGTEVKSMGLGGIGQVRESLTPILLGRFAEARLKVLMAKKLVSPTASFPGRPCLVCDRIADLSAL